MIDPPRPIGDMYALVYEGIEAIGRGDEMALNKLAELTSNVPDWIRLHLEMEHTFPSPSGVMRCRLAQWYAARGVEPDQKSPLSWKVRRAAGILQEPYFLAVLASGGAKVELPNKKYQCGPYMQAHPDAVMDDEFIIEIKSETGVGYKRLLETPGGVYVTEKSHFVQAQLYLYATGREYCLYLTNPPDPSLLQSDMRRYKRYGQNYELPAVYLEWIARDESTIEMALERAEMITNDKKKDTPPPKEFSGEEFAHTGKRAWPCGWCLNLTSCQRDSVPLRIGENNVDTEIVFS